MKVARVISVAVSTPAKATTTDPAVLPYQYDLFKRDTDCAVLNGYPNAQPPICVGQASMCTASAGRQGCCDKSGNCTFYTSCNGGFATPCTASGCLQCPSALPYCARYLMTDSSGGNYQGYGCLIADVSNSLIYGSIRTAPITGLSSISTKGSSSILTTTTNAGSSSSSSSSSSATSTSAATSDPVLTKSQLNIPAIAGGAAGGAVLILLILGIYIKIRRRKTVHSESRYSRQLQQ